MNQIVILDGYTENPGDLSWEGFENLGSVTYYDRTEKTYENIVARIGRADIVIVNKVPVSREIMDACPGIRYIGCLSTGFNVVDVKAAHEKGIIVTNIPTYGTDAVAQFTIGLILEACLHIGRYNDLVKQGAWQRSADFCFYDEPLAEISGKTLGIVGFGRIGRKTAELARVFGMKILAANSKEEERITEDGFELTTIDRVLRESDIVSFHCPLTERTTGLVCAENIAKMKDGVIVVNTSRGPVVNDRDLADALTSGKVGYACLDVLSEEPVKEDCPLLTAPRCIITPHVAWASKEARQRLMNTAVENLSAFLTGKPQNVVS